MITQKRVQEVLSYNPDTGIFIWIIQGKGITKGTRAGTINHKSYYRYIQIDRILYRAQRLAWLYVTGEYPSLDVDHKNKVRDDNRWENLRLATRSQNMANGSLRRDNSSGYKGVHWVAKRNKWLAYIRVNGKFKFIGYFTDIREAAIAYKEASIKHFEEFAG